ncbi:cartilage intermediate layer protein 2-like [Kryptolebias marmoratus]|uniref:cartilage intermediate layer protein 2-like n=1 Tax=Kryptolebias marmoratus TaxID=37003 RepID=UPI0007F8B1E6|nr:cartilage intermediate layer protein 2-like [Kryptolebias marmoratus]
MISQMSLAIAAVLLLACVGLSHQDRKACWTKWFNRDSPDGRGDMETLKDLRKEYPGEICLKPQSIEAVTAKREIPAEETKQKFAVYSVNEGFICLNKDQKSDSCLDYKVRFKCPCRRDR